MANKLPIHVQLQIENRVPLDTNHLKGSVMPIFTV